MADPLPSIDVIVTVNGEVEPSAETSLPATRSVQMFDGSARGSRPKNGAESPLPYVPTEDAAVLCEDFGES